MYKVNINVMTLNPSLCAVLKLGNLYDFRVYIYITIKDAQYDWFGVCFREDLQTCIETGIVAAKKFWAEKVKVKF